MKKLWNSGIGGKLAIIGIGALVICGIIVLGAKVVDIFKAVAPETPEVAAVIGL